MFIANSPKVLDNVLPHLLYHLDADVGCESLQDGFGTADVKSSRPSICMASRTLSRIGGADTSARSWPITGASSGQETSTPAAAVGPAPESSRPGGLPGRREVANAKPFGLSIPRKNVRGTAMSYILPSRGSYSASRRERSTPWVKPLGYQAKCA